MHKIRKKEFGCGYTSGLSTKAGPVRSPLSGVWIVDVRSGEEYRRSHIRYAVNIPYEPGKEWDLPGEKEIVVYCERGATSMAAVREMIRQGYRALSVAGGITEYKGRNLVFSE